MNQIFAQHKLNMIWKSLIARQVLLCLTSLTYNRHKLCDCRLSHIYLLLAPQIPPGNTLIHSQQQTHYPMLNKKQNRTLLLLPAVCLLASCSLTRVTEATHARDVDELKLVDMSLDAAKHKVTEQGFACSPGSALHSVQMDDGVHRWLQTECSKKNAELFCPQMRSIVLNADPESQKVVAVGKSITSHACFWISGRFFAGCYLWKVLE